MIKKYDVVYYDENEGRKGILASFTKEEDALRVLEYAKDNYEYEELGWVDFDFIISDLYTSAEKFISSKK